MRCGVMDDFIKRSDALKVIETANSMVSGLLEATMKLCVMMDRIAAADVAPVVRCGECENWQTDWKPGSGKDETHFCAMVGLCTSADWFCADGERKDGDGA